MSHSQPDFEEFNFNTAPEEKKFEEIAAEERKAIYTEQEEMGEGRVKDILHRYTKITTKSLEEYKKQAEEYEDEK